MGGGRPASGCLSRGDGLLQDRDACATSVAHEAFDTRFWVHQLRNNQAEKISKSAPSAGCEHSF